MGLPLTPTPVPDVSQQPWQRRPRRARRLLASSLNGDAHVGRLGNEKDNYAELSFGKKLTFNDGSWARFKTMLADGATNPIRGFRITTATI